jgi:phosphatidate cytidylyltransferase
MLLGLLANRLLALLPAGLAMQPLGWGAALLFTVLVAVSGQVGDLYESSLKRVGQIKDSGRLLPGHGGFLDRIDALLFGAPVAYGLYVVFA